MSILNTTPAKTNQPDTTISNKAFITTLAVLLAAGIFTCLTMWFIYTNAVTNANHAAVKYYVRTSVLMLNNSLDHGEKITYFAGTETLHGDHQTLRTHTTVDPLDKTHYTVSATSLTDGYTVSYDSWNADYTTSS